MSRLSRILHALAAAWDEPAVVPAPVPAPLLDGDAETEHAAKMCLQFARVAERVAAMQAPRALPEGVVSLDRYRRAQSK